MRKLKASQLIFEEGRRREANFLVRMYHYSDRVPAAVQHVFTFSFNGEVIAAAMFSSPAVHWSEDVLELTRLVRKDGLQVPLSRLISLGCKKLKQYGFDLLVSYADKNERHTGIVYQASGWMYHGVRESRLDGCILNGKFVPGRTLNARFGTQSVVKLQKRFPRIIPCYDDGKHLYWRALLKRGKSKANRLGLRNEPYPKPKQWASKEEKIEHMRWALERISKCEK